MSYVGMLFFSFPLLVKCPNKHNLCCFYSYIVIMSLSKCFFFPLSTVQTLQMATIYKSMTVNVKLPIIKDNLFPYYLVYKAIKITTLNQHLGTGQNQIRCTHPAVLFFFPSLKQLALGNPLQFKRASPRNSYFFLLDFCLGPAQNSEAQQLEAASLLRFRFAFISFELKLRRDQMT